MAVTGCVVCVKYLMFAFNFLFWLCGCALLGVGLWLCFDPSMKEYASTSGELQVYYIGVYILIGIGGFMMLVGFLGCCGACMESQALLVLFFILLLVICAAEVGGGIWAYLNRHKLKEGVTKGMDETVKNVYGQEPSVTVAFDGMQQALRCCGAAGPGDWLIAKYAEGNPGRVPDSCCKEQTAGCGTIGGQVADFFSNIASGGDVVSPVFTQGCADTLFNMLEENTILVAGLAIGVGAVQLLGMIFSCCLCCAIRRQDDNKYYS